MNFKDYFLKLYLAVGSCPSVDSYPPESKDSLLDFDSLSVMFPLNEETGHVVDLLTRLLLTLYLSRADFIHSSIDPNRSITFASASRFACENQGLLSSSLVSQLALLPSSSSA